MVHVYVHVRVLGHGIQVPLAFSILQIHVHVPDQLLGSSYWLAVSYGRIEVVSPPPY